MIAQMTRAATIRFTAALAVGCAMIAVLASCTSRPTSREAAATIELNRMQLVKQTPGSGNYTQCVPYARDVSGIQIYGDAWTWWSQANGRYSRGQTPRGGAVLTLKKTNKLNSGHVAVVASVVEPRRILVDHANWGDNADTRSKIHMRQPVIDVSPNNDWSQVRFMNTQGTFGAVYPAHGFIYRDGETRTAQN